MLNRAARYFSILDELQEYLIGDHRILEIGSGPEGIGQFYNRPFVGCDVAFSSTPKAPMLPVICSGTELPFADGFFDVVIASDVMEHLAPEQRAKMITEALRVAKKVAIFGFPCGDRALAIDQRLLADYHECNLAPPVWLLEHMLFTFPDGGLFQDLPDGWALTWKPNESLRFHSWLMHREMSRMWNYGFRAVLRSMPTVIRRILRSFDHEPSYRMIFTATRRSNAI